MRLVSSSRSDEVPVERILLDEHELLPFEENSQDCIISNLALHWVNDLPGKLSLLAKHYHAKWVAGVMIQARRTLRPDGAFICAMLGGDTLFELR